MWPKDLEGMANSVDPDPTDPSEAVWYMPKFICLNPLDR